jgi:uncharacterized protein
LKSFCIEAKLGKVLLWALLIIGGLLIARMLARQGEKHRVGAKAPRQAPRRGSAAIPQPEAMVRCAHCGVHMPRSEALLTNGQTWCCPEHAKLGARQ